MNHRLGCDAGRALNSMLDPQRHALVDACDAWIVPNAHYPKALCVRQVSQGELTRSLGKVILLV
jgi:hypothetical protein